MKTEHRATEAAHAATWAVGEAPHTSQVAREAFNDTAVLQGAAEHQHRCHRHHRRMTEAGEGVRGRYKPHHHGDQQRAQSYEVMAPAWQPEPTSKVV